ncbi:MAG: hypothetical protein FWC73_09490 [Defluviitaleaceae bacterium]|nr:hypothetical protein [Defluviitaleaceae bacterium]
MENTLKRAESLVEIYNMFMPKHLTRDQLGFYHKTAAVRDGAHYEFYLDLYKSIQTNNSFAKLLVVGHLGCGKSTELQMLRAMMSNDNLADVYINASDDLDLFGLTYIDLLVLLVEKIVEYAKENNLSVDRHILASFEEVLKTKITSSYWEADGGVSVEASASAKVSVPFFLEIVSKIKTTLKIASGAKEVLRKEYEPKARDIIAAINALIVDLSAQSARKFVVIIDGLERGRQEAVNTLFTKDIAFLSDIKTHLILGCPISTYRSIDVKTIKSYFLAPVTIPMIKTHNKDRTPYSDGIKTIESLLLKRVDATFFEDDVLTTIITKAGGNLRDTFYLVSQCAFEAYMRERTTVDMDSVNFTLRKFTFDTFMSVPSTSYARAKKIYEGDHTVTQEKELEDLLYTGAALEYNGERWVDLAPLVREYVDKNPGILG